MRHRVLPWTAVLVQLPMLGMACRDGNGLPPRGSAPRDKPAVLLREPQSRPFVVVDANTIRVTYDTRLSPDPLTRKQVQEIAASAISGTDANKPIWYMLVRYNREDSASATVFFEPEFSNARLRKGLFLKYEDDGGQHLWPLLRYWQVSPLDVPFSRQLETPSKWLWPFSVDGRFADKEVVRIVDYVRGVIRSQPGTIQGLPLDGDEPVLRIERMHNGDIDVYTGTVQHELAGYGHSLVLRQHGDTYRILASGDWLK